MNKPNEKAKELLDKFRPHAKYWDCFYDEPLKENHAKQCALIAVDEILKVAFYTTDEIYNYYIKVKQEIEKL
jgi:hypothetical protein